MFNQDNNCIYWAARAFGISAEWSLSDFCVWRKLIIKKNGKKKTLNSHNDLLLCCKNIKKNKPNFGDGFVSLWMPPLCLGADSVTDYTPLLLPYHIALFYFGGGILKHISHWSLFPSNTRNNITVAAIHIANTRKMLYWHRKRLDSDVREKLWLRWDQTGHEETQDVISDEFLAQSNLPITCCLL